MSSDDFEELVRSLGDEVWIHTARCQIWKAKHPNCCGCPSELGCGKVVHLLGVVCHSMTYQPTSFEDYQKMENRITELQQRILKAKTPEELRAIPDV